MKNYQSPAMEVVDMKMQEMLCASVSVPALFALSPLDSYNQDAGNIQGFDW